MNIKNTIAVAVTAVAMLSGCSSVAVKVLASQRGAKESSSSFLRPAPIVSVSTQFNNASVPLTIRAQYITPQDKVQSLALFQKTNKLIAEQVPQLTANLLASKGVVSGAEYRLKIRPSQGFFADTFTPTPGTFSSAEFFYYAELLTHDNRRAWVAMISIPVGSEADAAAAPQYLAKAIVRKLAGHGWVRSDPGDPPVDLRFKPDWRDKRLAKPVAQYH